jgi:hypothetical protein
VLWVFRARHLRTGKALRIPLVEGTLEVDPILKSSSPFSTDSWNWINLFAH